MQSSKRLEVEHILSELMDGRRSFFPLPDSAYLNFPELEGRIPVQSELDMWTQANYWIRATYRI